MILEFLLLRVEIEFYNYRKNKNLYLAPQVGLHNLAGTDYAFETLDFVRDYEKTIFLNVEEFAEKDNLVLKNFKEEFRKKIFFLEQLVQVYAAGYQDNLVQLGFYRLWVKSLESLIDKSHPAFADREGFLNRSRIVHKKDFPEGTVLANQLKSVSKPLIKKSPEKVILAFEYLALKGFCDLQNAEGFVYSAFNFPSQYKVPPAGFFAFNWKKNPSYHSLTVMIRDLHKKRSIPDSKAILEEWLSVLLPLVSQKSIKKYLGSKGEEFSEKNRIDIQIFN